ncbi:MAG TPA: serine hydrolase domain-containing protein, partial [Gemmatimonadales bacterium]|nr:serine hydrolase domain-containing protein [Gemmatimonadales bacterium]
MTAAAAAFSRTRASAQAPLGAANEKVRAVLESIVKDTTEIGLQVAAYVDGKLVIDAWAGMADEATKRPVDRDTMFMLSSTTKGVTATCMHVMAEKHMVS